MNNIFLFNNIIMVEKKIPANYCAPCSEGAKYKKGKGKDKNNYKTTCYSTSSLLKIIKAWNQKYITNPIILDDKQKNNKSYLWKLVQQKLSSSCHNNEKCWKSQEFIKKMKDTEIEFYTFKPTYPKEWLQNKYTWLNTYDILHVMKQYEKLYKNFMFLGPVPADCPTKINCELSNLSLTKLHKNGIDNVGIIYNLDMSYQGGSHWVAMFIDIKNNEINYYDSTASMPTPLIKKFIVNIGNKILRKNKDVKVIYNDKKHQYGGSECGVYSMNFILERLSGVSMYEISNMKIPDEGMNHLRKILYSL